VLNTVWATIRDGKIELLEEVALPEGGKVLVTLIPTEDDAAFWQQASQASLEKVWDNAEDDVYAELLEE
jgi:hypothetical protein